MACQKVCKQGRDDAWKQRSHIGKAPSLHLFHTTVSAWKLLGSYLILTTYKAHIPIRLMHCICC